MIACMQHFRKPILFYDIIVEQSWFAFVLSVLFMLRKHQRFFICLTTRRVCITTDRNIIPNPA